MPFAEPVTRVVPLPERVSPLRGEFVDAALEQDFRASTLSRVLPQQRAGLVLWAALMIGFVVPDYLDLGAVPHFWILAVYRVGFYTGKDYINADGNEYKMRALTFGFGFNLKKWSNYDNQSTFINTAFEIGKRGSSVNNITENFFKMSVGFSLSDLWFSKRRYD